MAWKDLRLIAPLINYPLANQSAQIATIGRFNISMQPLVLQLLFGPV